MISRDHLHRRRLTCAIWSQKTKNLRRLSRKAEVVDGRLGSEFFSYMTDLH